MAYSRDLAVMDDFHGWLDFTVYKLFLHIDHKLTDLHWYLLSCYCDWKWVLTRLREDFLWKKKLNVNFYILSPDPPKNCDNFWQFLLRVCGITFNCKVWKLLITFIITPLMKIFSCKSTSRIANVCKCVRLSSKPLSLSPFASIMTCKKTIENEVVKTIFWDRASLIVKRVRTASESSHNENNDS